MRPIPLGTKGTFTLRVLPEHLANQFKDAILPQVLATPVMILTMENAALNAIRPFLEVGESAVGTAINVRHLAATPVGHTVRAEAEVTKVDGKRIEFKVSARDGIEEIGAGTHQRALINLRSFNERLAAKSARGFVSPPSNGAEGCPTGWFASNAPVMPTANGSAHQHLARSSASVFRTFGGNVPMGRT